MRSVLLNPILFSVPLLAFPALNLEAISNRKHVEKINAKALRLSGNIGVPRKGVSSPIPSSNCGPIPCTTFDKKDQYVDVSPGSFHEYIKPGPADIRGPCPGLNAAANHAFLPHNGIPSISQTVLGLGEAYGMAFDLAGFLAVFGVILAGDPLTQTWSIGGPFPGSILNKKGGEPQGISFSHDKYEGDASPCRDDAYNNGGDAHSLIMEKFEHLYSLADSYTTHTMYEQFKYNVHRSITQNPYYFSAPFSGLLAAPVAHYFITNLMSNHSEENKGGYLDRDMLKTFFAVKGEPGSFKWYRGEEKIPQNWYRRPLLNPYTTQTAFLDIQLGYAQHPYLFRVGGNMGETNTYTGVELTDITNGVYNSDNIFKNNYIGCFAFQSMQIALADYVKNYVQEITPITNLVDKYMKPIIKNSKCPELEKYNQGLFNKFPGYHYKPHPKP